MLQHLPSVHLIAHFIDDTRLVGHQLFPKRFFAQKFVYMVIAISVWLVISRANRAAQ